MCAGVGPGNLATDQVDETTSQGVTGDPIGLAQLGLGTRLPRSERRKLQRGRAEALECADRGAWMRGGIALFGPAASRDDHAGEQSDADPPGHLDINTPGCRPWIPSGPLGARRTVPSPRSGPVDPSAPAAVRGGKGPDEEPGEGSVSRAVVCVRVSSREQAEGGYSIESQLDACRRFAIEKGWTIEDEFTELGESARTANRTAFKAMTALLEEHGDISYLVVHKIDRLARNLADHAAIKARCKKLGIRLVPVTEGMEEGPSGRLVEGIMAAIAEFYSDNLGQEGPQKHAAEAAQRRLAQSRSGWIREHAR